MYELSRARFKMGFFYDGDLINPYKDFEDRYGEVEHLVWLTLIPGGLIAIVLIFVFFFTACLF